jgi:translation initiation factor IF-1
MKTENIPCTGRVVESLADYKFRVVINGAGHQVIAHLCGKMIKHHIVVTVGDEVECEVSSYDLSRGRITQRFR